MNTLKRIMLAAGLTLAVAVPLLTPQPAEAWWHGGGWGYHPGWGWHGGWGWGWRGGVYVGVPPVVVGAPAVAYPPPAYGYHWVPGYYAPGGAFVPGHWGYY